MLKVSGQVYVTNLREVSPRLITGTIYTFEKLGEEFKTTFIKAKFVGKAIEHLILKDVKEKDKVFVKSGILKSNTWTNKEGKTNAQVELTVFELDEIKTETTTEPVKETNRFKRWDSDLLGPIDLGDTPF